MVKIKDVKSGETKTVYRDLLQEKMERLDVYTSPQAFFKSAYWMTEQGLQEADNRFRDNLHKMIDNIDIDEMKIQELHDMLDSIDDTLLHQLSKEEAWLEEAFSYDTLFSSPNERRNINNESAIEKYKTTKNKFKKYGARS